LHNLAFCYQKTNNFDLCVDYLEAVIFNYDGLLETKYKIKIDIDYFKNVNNAHLPRDKSPGDMILQVRYSAKFHLQMCAVLSQANNHEEAIRHARLASYMCEDNILKTYYLYYQVKEELNNRMNSNAENTDNIKDLMKLDDKLNEMKKVINNLHKQILEIRNYKHNSNKKSFE
jgi:tetratricopeptide (TPR) repeat protein